MRRTGPLASCAAAMIVVLAGPASANDDSSHLWVTEKALQSLPAGCAMTELLQRAEARQMIDNGTIFPDFGYVPQQSQAAADAGEASHWEPFYDAYASYIRNMTGFPSDPYVESVLAHYMGVVSHNMSDELYDSMYFTRVVQYDAHDMADADEYLGYAMIDAAGTRPAPQSWIPMDDVLAVFTGLGYSPDSAAVQYGVTTVGLSITGMNTIYAVRVGQSKSMFPWGSSHLLDATVHGSPASYAPAIARWWQTRWAIAHGKKPPSPVFETWPHDTAVNHATQASSVESWINIGMARHVESSALDSKLRVKDSKDNVLPVDYAVYYQHIVQLKPKQDLAADETYTVELDPGLLDATGLALEAYRFRFSTGATAPSPTVNPTFWDQCVGEMDNPPPVILPEGWDAGADGAADGPVDAAPDADAAEAEGGADAAQQQDAAAPKDAAPEGGADGAASLPETPASDGGCSCEMRGASRVGVWPWLAIGIALMLRKRSRDR